MRHNHLILLSIVFAFILPSCINAGVLDIYQNMANDTINKITGISQGILEAEDINDELLTKIGNAYLSDEITDKQKSLIENKLSEQDLDYAKKSAQREEQALEQSIVYEKNKEEAYKKINKIMDVYLVVFRIGEELLKLSFYVLEMYLLLLIFLKIIPFTFRKIVESLGGGFSKVTGGDKDV